MADKHVHYFALEKACVHSGCPLCQIVDERIKKYIDNMLFEHVSDRGFRKQFRESGGFCNEHSRNLDSFRDGLAVAILSKDVLENAMPSLIKHKVPHYREKCPACSERDRIENEFLSFLCELSPNQNESDDKLISLFEKSDGLCFVHFKQLVSSVKKIPKWLFDFHIDKYNSLMERTGQFIEFSAWGRQADFSKLSENDKKVWQEVSKKIRGDL